MDKVSIPEVSGDIDIIIAEKVDFLYFDRILLRSGGMNIVFIILFWMPSLPLYVKRDLGLNPHKLTFIQKQLELNEVEYFTRFRQAKSFRNLGVFADEL